MAKDWPGRPLYLQAAISSYFASRQWIQAVRSWVGDDAFWRRAQAFRANQRHLDHDLDGAYKISLYSGHWQGQGEPFGGERGPGGSLISLRQAIKHYFQPTFNVGNLRGRTEYRSRFEGLIRRMADPQSGRRDRAGAVEPGPPAGDADRRPAVLDMRGRGLGDPGPDDADMYASVRIAGQPMTSAVIHGARPLLVPEPQRAVHVDQGRAGRAGRGRAGGVGRGRDQDRRRALRGHGRRRLPAARPGPALQPRQAALQRLRARRPRHLQRPDRRRGAARHARRRHPRAHDREGARRHRRRLEPRAA